MKRINVTLVLLISTILAVLLASCIVILNDSDEKTSTATAPGKATELIKLNVAKLPLPCRGQLPPMQVEVLLQLLDIKYTIKQVQR